MALTVVNKPPDVHLSKTQAFYKIQSDSINVPNLRIECDVIGNGTLGTDVLTPDETGLVTFELSDYLRPHVKPSFTFPDVGEDFVFQWDGRLLYDVIFKEYGGSPSVLIDTLSVENETVIWGFIPQYLHNSFYRNNASFKAWIIGSAPLLTFWPAIRTVYSKSQTEKLFLLNLLENAQPEYSYQLILDLNFTDGTTERVLHDKTIGPAQYKYSVIEFHTGYNALDIDTVLEGFPGKVLKSYIVSAAFNEVQSSSTVEYVLDLNKHFPNRREFIFRNPLGGYDTFVATGVSETESSFKPEIVKVTPWLGGTGNIQKTINNEYTEKIKCNSGFVSADLMAAMPQFFESDDIYEIIDEHLYPVIIMEQSIVRKTDRKGMFSFEFEYSHVPIVAVETV